MDNVNEEQPAPTPQPEHLAIWPLVVDDMHKYSAKWVGPMIEIRDRVIADMQERDTIGRAKYGVPLTIGNGRDHLVDAYQEALDLAVYLRAWLEEHPPEGVTKGPTRDTIRELYVHALVGLMRMREAMRALGG